ncbi:MAG: class I SAM-dependent methyltransferase [Bacteroidota bacterium]
MITKLKKIVKNVLGIQPAPEPIMDPINRDPKVKRYDIMNALIQKNGYKTYLEIGVRNPQECFAHINCEEKKGVDPGVEGDFPVDFNMTSDQFFAQNTNKYDIIFIDGLHIDEQVKRDIENAIQAITPNGCVVLHDCNPPDLHHAREDYYDFDTPAKDYWNGTTWKAIVDFRASGYAHTYECNVVNTDYGIGIIRAMENGERIVNDNPFYSYRKLEKERERYLGLISVETFFEKYIN